MTDVNQVINQRGKTHGDFADVAAVDQALKEALRGGRNWAKLSVSHRCALEMIVHKAARILSGDPNESDHWLDIQGYAGLGFRAVQKSQIQDGVSEAAQRIVSARPIPVRTLNFGAELGMPVRDEIPEI